MHGPVGAGLKPAAFELNKTLPRPRQGERTRGGGACFAKFSTPLILAFSPQGEKEFFFHRQESVISMNSMHNTD
jgi:hypothetical protein